MCGRLESKVIRLNVLDELLVEILCVCDAIVISIFGGGINLV